MVRLGIGDVSSPSVCMYACGSRGIGPAHDEPVAQNVVVWMVLEPYGLDGSGKCSCMVWDVFTCDCCCAKHWRRVGNRAVYSMHWCAVKLCLGSLGKPIFQCCTTSCACMTVHCM